MISSSDKLIPVPDEAWASVSHGDCIQLHGEVLIADLIKLRGGATVKDGISNEGEWRLWKDREGVWHASGPVIGIGFPWWTDEVTYRGEVLK
jgi:hypothetical protein